MKNVDAKYYNELIGGLKNTDIGVIDVNNVKLQKSINYVGTVPLEHITIDKPMLLIAECSIEVSNNFGFKLLSKHFSEKPFFRFETSGSVHQNRYEDIPLAQQQIPTPHFHGYDDKGRWIAYHTAQLDNAIHNGDIKDVQIAFSIFCNETNVRYKNTIIPTIVSIPCGDLNLRFERENPLENVNFA